MSFPHRSSTDSPISDEHRSQRLSSSDATSQTCRLSILPLDPSLSKIGSSHLNDRSFAQPSQVKIMTYGSKPILRSDVLATAAAVSPLSLTSNSNPLQSRTETCQMDLASLFECPVCMDFALPPILQCQSGHIVCATCRAKLSSCPTCRGSLDNIRNLAMEKLAASVYFPCKYSTTGCGEALQYNSKVEHEAICEFRPYVCPCPGSSCKWLGQLDKVMPHLMRHHKSITTLQGEDIVFLATDITLAGAVDWVMMQSCFDHHFMLVLEKQERVPDHLFFALVLLIGTKMQAENFVYRLDLTAPTRRLTWEATPHSIQDGVQTAIAVSDCLVFDSNTAQLFADNSSLGINVTISKVLAA